MNIKKLKTGMFWRAVQAAAVVLDAFNAIKQNDRK
jgi:hypothetical protein